MMRNNQTKEIAMTSESKITATVIIDGDEIEGIFHRNSHGWFCDELNGMGWDYSTGVQAASKSIQEAAEHFVECFWN